MIVSFLKTAGGLPNPIATFGNADSAVLHHVMFQIAAVYQFHNQIEKRRHARSGRQQLAGVVSCHDVGMMQISQHQDFGIKALQQGLGAFVVHGQDFDGHAPLHEIVLSQEDYPHRARSQTLEHLVVTQDESVQGPGQDSVQLILGQEVGLH